MDTVDDAAAGVAAGATPAAEPLADGRSSCVPLNPVTLVATAKVVTGLLPFTKLTSDAAPMVDGI